MPQGTGTTVKEVAGVDPEVKTNIRKVGKGPATKSDQFSEKFQMKYQGVIC